MDNYPQAIAELLRYLPHIRELSGRTPPIQKAIVTDLRPEERLAKVTTEAKAGVTQSYWVQCGRSRPHTDEPLPPIGTTVIIAFCNGSPSDGYILRTLANQTNPPDEGQSDPAKDNTTAIPGDDFLSVMGDRVSEIRGDHAHAVWGDFKIQVQGDELSIDCTPKGDGDGDITATAQNNIDIDSASGRIRLFARTGRIELIAPMGITLKQGASTLSVEGGTWAWDLAGDAVHITNATDFTINGKSAIVVNSTDSSGDINNARGY